MSKLEIEEFRRLILYALMQSKKLPSPVVGDLLRMANEELNSLVPSAESPANRTTDRVMAELNSSN